MRAVVKAKPPPGADVRGGKVRRPVPDGARTVLRGGIRGTVALLPQLQ